MPKLVDPIKQERVYQARKLGKSKSQALRDAGYSEAVAGHHVHEMVVLNRVDERILAEERITDKYIIDQLQAILKLKLSVEKKLFEFIDHYKRITPQNLRNVTLAINKTKDNITEISKLLRLYNGDTTENVQLSDDEFKEKHNRLLGMAKLYETNKPQTLEN